MEIRPGLSCVAILLLYSQVIWGVAVRAYENSMGSTILPVACVVQQFDRFGPLMTKEPGSKQIHPTSDFVLQYSYTEKFGLQT